MDQAGMERALHALGLGSNYAGYRCLLHILPLVREAPERLELITKELYPEAARLCGMTPSGVDSALRIAIDVCARRNGAGLARLCGSCQPSVSDFLAGLAEAACRESGGE